MTTQDEASKAAHRQAALRELDRRRSEGEQTIDERMGAYERLGAVARELLEHDAARQEILGRYNRAVQAFGADPFGLLPADWPKP